MLEHVLIRARYEVDPVSGVVEGIRLLGRHRYDLVIADARLPDGIGMQVVDLAAEKGSKTLILTGYAFAYPELRNYNYLLKPLRPHELLEEVERLLGLVSCPGALGLVRPIKKGDPLCPACRVPQ